MITKSAIKLLKQIQRESVKYEDCVGHDENSLFWRDLRSLHVAGYTWEINLSDMKGWTEGSYYMISYPAGVVFLEGLDEQAKESRIRWVQWSIPMAISLIAIIISIISLAMQAH